MKSYISTPIENKETGDISYVQVPLEAAFGIGNVLYMTSDARMPPPNTPTAAAPVTTAPEPTDHAVDIPVVKSTTHQERPVSNLTRLLRMVGLRS
jgi:hypothetical protein